MSKIVLSSVNEFLTRSEMSQISGGNFEYEGGCVHGGNHQCNSGIDCHEACRCIWHPNGEYKYCEN